MKEQLVSFETAKLAKEKGFDLKCQQGWRKAVSKTDNFMKLPNGFCYDANGNDYTINRPTQALLQKWLREVHNIDVSPIKFTSGGYWVVINRGNENDSNFYHTNLTSFKTYEKALEKGLQKALKLI